MVTGGEKVVISPSAKLTITQVEGNYFSLGEILYVFQNGDDAAKAEYIRKTFKYAGRGICDTKNKPIDIYYDEKGCQMWGVSAVKTDRTFKVSDKPNPMV